MMCTNPGEEQSRRVTSFDERANDKILPFVCLGKTTVSLRGQEAQEQPGYRPPFSLALENVK